MDRLEYTTVYGPEIQVENSRSIEPYYLESWDRGISYVEAKESNLKIYSGSKIRGFIPKDYHNLESSNAEVYFLEINE